jgi:hypothetical protein
LDLDKNTELSDLWCRDNKIKGEEMTKLIASLDDRSTMEDKGTMYGITFNPSNDGNVITVANVAAAKARGWKIKDGFGNDYPGIDPTAIEGVQRGDDATPTAIYDVSGRRIGQMQRGINIVKMRNGRTRKVVK